MSVTNVESNRSNYLRILYYYAKSRTQVYMYLGPVVISMLIASYGNLDPLVGVPMALATFLAALGIYMYNDLTDFNIDKINSSNRPLVSGMASKRDILTITILLNAGALALAFSANIYAMLGILSFIFLGILYSHPKISLKEKFPHKTVATAFGAAIVSLVGGLAVGNVSSYVIYAALVTFAFLFIMGPIADISDLKGDRVARRRTFPLVLGVNKTLGLMMLVTVGIITSAILSLEILHMNIIGLMMIVGIGSFVVLTLRSLMQSWQSAQTVWNTRNKMKTMHILLQISLFIGVFQLV